MNFEDFHGLNPQLIRFREEISAGRGVHAYLFQGPFGTGKRSMAEVAARAVHCTAEKKPCGVCAMCKLHLADSHPDFIRVRPERTIGVDAVRELTSKLAVKPFEGHGYAVVIEQADKMTTQAQNALLKTIETPPGDVVFFLTTESPGGLLSTIRSRLREIRFTPIADDALMRALADHGILGIEARRLIPVARGSVGQALKTSEDEGYWALYRQVFSALEAIKQPSDVLQASDALAQDKDRAADILDLLEYFASELIRLKHSSDIMENDFKKIQHIQADKLMEGAARARRELQSNVRWQYILELLFFSVIGG